VIYVNGGHVMLVDGVLDEFIDDPVDALGSSDLLIV
jgi:hypothetical protein